MPSADVLIVGAGPGGVGAAVQLHRLGVEAAWWDESGVIGGLLENAHCVENWPGMPLGASGRVCCEVLARHARAFGLHPERRKLVHFEETPDDVHVRDEEGRRLVFHALVLAVGTRPVSWAPLQGLRLAAYEYRHLPPPSGKLLVIGGGEAACDGALHWAETGQPVVMAVRAASLKARGLLARRVLSHPCIRVLFSTTVEHLEEVGDHLACTLKAADGGLTAEEIRAALFCGGRKSALSAWDLPQPYQLRLSSRVWAVGDARRGHLGQGVMAVSDALKAAAEITDFLCYIPQNGGLS